MTHPGYQFDLSKSPLSALSPDELIAKEAEERAKVKPRKIRISWDQGRCKWKASFQASFIPDFEWKPAANPPVYADSPEAAYALFLEEGSQDKQTIRELTRSNADLTERLGIYRQRWYAAEDARYIAVAELAAMQAHFGPLPEPDFLDAAEGWDD